jgi:hypothetical protein
MAEDSSNWAAARDMGKVIFEVTFLASAVQNLIEDKDEFEEERRNFQGTDEEWDALVKERQAQLAAKAKARAKELGLISVNSEVMDGKTTKQKHWWE